MALNMTEVIVTRKGQVTIPKELRDRFGIEEGNRVEILRKGDEIVIRKVQRDLEDVLGAWSDLSLRADFLEELRKEWGRRFDRLSGETE